MDDKLRKLQLAELEILKVFIKICEENGLKYYLMGGTLIGAVRHKGFIPWDDDIDVVMPRKDYEKLKKIAKEKLPEDMKYLYFKDIDRPIWYYSQIESEKIKIKDNSTLVEKVKNCWIDIFPLDGMPNNIIGEKIHLFYVLFKRTLINYSQYSLVVNQKLQNRPLIERIYVKIGKMIKWEKILKTKKCMLKLDKRLKKYDYDKSKKIGSFIGVYKWKEIYPREFFGEGIMCDFEDIKARIPNEYDKILKKMYGDYMKIPPESERKRHFIEFE